MSEELFVPSEVGLKSRSIDISSYTKQLKPLFAVLYHWSFGIPLVLVFFAVWEALPRLGIINPLFLPPFSTTLKTLIDLTLSGELLSHSLVSLQRSAAGFSLALLIAVPFGFLMGHFVQFEKYTDLLVQSLRNVSLSLDLDKKILVRKSHTEFPATDKKAKEIHDDLMIVYSDNSGNPSKAIYFDNEGHTINYAVTFSDKSIILTSEKIQNAPVFRLTYTLLEDKRVNTKFEMSQDGEKFTTYIEGKSRKTK